MLTRTGGCHCGRVRFEVKTPAQLRVTYCNCSICAKVGFLHVIVPKSHFRLLSGVKSFYVPRSHPDGYSVNARCLDDVEIESLNIVAFDGKHWEEQFKEGRSATLDD